MKTQVRKNCNGCAITSYPLQHRFDEDGWYKVLDLMKMVNVLGVYPRPDGSRRAMVITRKYLRARDRKSS